MTLAHLDTAITDLSEPYGIISAIEQRFMDFGLLYNRMDEDFERYRLTPSKPIAGEALLEKDIYTGNDPYVLARQVISYITSSERQVHVPNQRADEQKREANQALEQFVTGLYNQVDKQFLERSDPRLIAQLAAFAVIRGPLMVRRLLRKDEYGETVPDALVMDPRWTAFSRGSSGLRWVCHKVRRSRDEVAETYRVAVPGSGPGDHDTDTYDYYWRGEGMFLNGVLCPAVGWLKPPSIVYSKQFPVVVIGGDDLPMLQNGGLGQGNLAQWSESVFAANRDVWKASDRTDSYLQALTARAVNQVILVESLEGNKTYETNPNIEGGVLPVSVQNREKVTPMQLSATTHDAQLFAGSVRRSKDMGGLPPQSFGIADPPLSGTAYRQLGARVEHVITPFLTRVEQALQLIAEGWCEDFRTGFYKPVMVYGISAKRQPFELEATPDVIAMASRPIVKLRAKLPEDQLEKYATATQAVAADPKTGQRLVSYKHARDHILQIDDAAWTGQEVDTEMANSASPYAQAMQMAKAAFKDGNIPLAQYYARQMQRVLQKEQAEDFMMMMSMQPPPLEGEGEGGRPPEKQGPAAGNDPRAVHSRRFGNNPDTASPDAGYATRNDRPGAQGPATRSARQSGVERQRR